ncbi:hypothetical protein NDU88_010119 [Pleurodeles waltl]|uniref:Uncharacterized protein n=1 Tax=Pleurodeles waltl TaxID=8319 RepID=A0AAV7S0D4_PLEWA|nr:hypothetical protein NDU88_010119 [Pleurodeles waltl]
MPESVVWIRAAVKRGCASGRAGSGRRDARRAQEPGVQPVLRPTHDLPLPALSAQILLPRSPGRGNGVLLRAGAWSPRDSVLPDESANFCEDRAWGEWVHVLMWRGHGGVAGPGDFT